MNLVLVVPRDQQFGGVAAVVGHLTRGLRKSKDEVVFLYQGTQTRLRATLLRNSYTPGLLWLLPIKLVVSVHGADFFEDGERLRRYPWPLRFLLFSSDAVVAPSQAFLKDCLAALPRNCEQGSVHPQRHRHRRACPGSHAIDIVTGRRYVLCIAAHNRKRRWTCSSAPLPGSVKSSETYSWCSSGDRQLRREHGELARWFSVQDRTFSDGAAGSRFRTCFAAARSSYCRGARSRSASG